MKRIEKDKPLPKHTKLDYDECYAKTVLESLLQKQLYDLTLSDRPDLFSEELNIGIEVTTAISQNEQERMNCWADIPYVNEGQKKRKIERMQQLKVEYQGGIQGWPVRDYSSNEIEDTPINEIKMAFEKKVKKLNKGNYRLFARNNLFINSDVWLCKDSFKQSLLKILIAKNSGKEKFTYVYLLVPGNFYTFDLVNKKYSEIPVESCLQAGWAVQARKMVEEGEDNG